MGYLGSFNSQLYPQGKEEGEKILIILPVSIQHLSCNAEGGRGHWSCESHCLCTWPGSLPKPLVRQFPDNFHETVPLMGIEQSTV